MQQVNLFPKLNYQINFKIFIFYRIYFAGNFVKNHRETMELINFAIEYFSKKDGIFKEVLINILFKKN